MNGLWSLLLLLAQLAGGPPRQLQVQLQPGQPRQGQLFVVTVSGPQPGDRLEGKFSGRRVRFFVDEAGRIRALVAVPLKLKPGGQGLVLELTTPEGEEVIHGAPVEVRAGEFAEQELKVEPRFVKPPPRMRARIRRERRRLRRLWRAPATERQWRGSFVWPRRDKICSSFGLRRTFNGRLRSRHWGLDIDGRTGDPVRAIGAGRVVLVDELYYAGGTVVIDHGLRLFSLYFHLSEFSVQAGQRVAKGQLIGKVGESGRVTGPHLHLSCKLEGVSFDPQSLLEADLAETPGEQR